MYFLSSFIMEELKFIRGKRIRLVRSMTGMTIADFAKNIGVSRGALIGWENGKTGGLTEKGATKISDFVQTLNINCTSMWLMHGLDSAPTFTQDHPEFAPAIAPDPSPTYLTHMDDSLPKKIVAEVEFFIKNNPGSITCQVEDDCMLPAFGSGDIVGGIKKTSRNIETAIGDTCIVETNTHKVMVRRLAKGSKNGVYNLAGINPNTPAAETFIADVKLIFAAPVIWVRYLDEH